MCRCNPQIRTPYCNKCNHLMPRMGVNRKGTTLYEILLSGWAKGSVDLTFERAQENGYIITIGEVEIAFLIFDEQNDITMRNKT